MKATSPVAINISFLYTQEVRGQLAPISSEGQVCAPWLNSSMVLSEIGSTGSTNLIFNVVNCTGGATRFSTIFKEVGVGWLVGWLVGGVFVAKYKTRITINTTTSIELAIPTP